MDQACASPLIKHMQGCLAYAAKLYVCKACTTVMCTAQNALSHSHVLSDPHSGPQGP